MSREKDDLSKGNFVPWQLPAGCPEPTLEPQAFTQIGHVRFAHFAHDGDPTVIVVNPHPSRRNLERQQRQLEEQEAIENPTTLVDVQAAKLELVEKVKAKADVIGHAVALELVRDIDQDEAERFEKELAVQADVYERQHRKTLRARKPKATQQ